MRDQDKKFYSNYTLDTIACPSCTSSQYEILCKKGMHDIPINTAICKSCGFVYLNPRWDKTSYDDFNKNYDLYFTQQRQSNTASKIAKYRVVLQRLEAHYDCNDNQDLSILDIGSGYGDSIMVFKEAFPKSKLYSIEPSEDAIKRLGQIGVTNIATDVDSGWQNTEKKI